MSNKLHTWLTIAFKCFGALGGAIAIGGLLFLLLGIKQNEHSQFWTFNDGKNMLISGSITYVTCFAICYFLARFEETQT